MVRANLRRNNFACTVRIHGMVRSRSAGSVQTNTPTHQAMTSTSSVSPNHSHDAEYGEGPITNRSTSSGTGFHPRT